MIRTPARPVLLISLAWLCSLGGCAGSDTPVVSELTLTEEPDMTAFAHKPSEQIDEVFQKVERVLNNLYAETLPQRFPNWIAFHAHLMFGESAYGDFTKEPGANDNLKTIYAILLHSDTEHFGAYVLRSGSPYPRNSGPYFMQEHHPNQFLTYFSMGGGPLDGEIDIDGKVYNFQDLLDRSLLEARPSGELAYTVLAYSHYLEPRKRWLNKFDESVSLAILLERLLKTPETTCLGTHRIAAFARTLSHEDLRTDADIERLWPELQRQVYAELLFLKQNQRVDGGFRLPGTTAGTPSHNHRDVYYTGHSLEWITFLDGQYLCDEWIVHAIHRLAEAISATHLATYRNMDVAGTKEAHFDFDGLSHAVSALRRWHDLIQYRQSISKGGPIVGCKHYGPESS